MVHEAILCVSLQYTWKLLGKQYKALKKIVILYYWNINTVKDRIMTFTWLPVGYETFWEWVIYDILLFIKLNHTSLVIHSDLTMSKRVLLCLSSVVFHQHLGMCLPSSHYISLRPTADPTFLTHSKECIGNKRRISPTDLAKANRCRVNVKLDCGWFCG